MLPVKTFLTEEKIEELASRSNFRYGKQILKNDTITFVDTNTFNIHAEIAHKNAPKIKVSIMSTTKGLRWKCDCTSKKNFFCEHCVAVALASTISNSRE